MPFPTLIQGDNRLLAGSINDFGMYGAPVVPHDAITGIPRTGADPLSFTPASQSSAPHLASATDEFLAAPAESVPITASLAQGGAASTTYAMQALQAAPLGIGDGAHLPANPAPAETHAFDVTPLAHHFTPTAPADTATSPQSAAVELPVIAGDSAILSAPMFYLPTAAIQELGDTLVELPALPPLTALPDLQPVTATLDGLAGSNPLGGIDTLVDLMRTADVFELRSSGSELIDHGTAPVIDVLADIPADAPLLGDLDLHHADTGLLGSSGDHDLLGIV